MRVPQTSFATTSTHRGGVPTGAVVPPLPEREGFIAQAAQYLLEAEYFYRTTGLLQVCARRDTVDTPRDLLEAEYFYRTTGLLQVCVRARVLSHALGVS